MQAKRFGLSYHNRQQDQSVLAGPEEAMARAQRFHLVVSFGAMLITSIATAATPVTFYFDDQSRFERDIAPGRFIPMSSL